MFESLFDYFGKKSAPPAEPKKLCAEDISFSVDLIAIAHKYLDLFEYFERTLDNVTWEKGPVFCESREQYIRFLCQKIWQPHNTQQPTPVVHYFWYCHALRPHEYKGVIEQICSSSPKEQKTELPFDFSIPEQGRWGGDESAPPLANKLDERQENLLMDLCQHNVLRRENLTSEFIWLKNLRNLIFPQDYHSACFLEKQLKYYKRFLAVTYNSGLNTLSDGPHMGIDLIWHSHILSGAYFRDFSKFSEIPPSHHPYTHDKAHQPPFMLSTLRKAFHAEYGKRMDASLIAKDENPLDPFVRLPKDVFLEILNSLCLNDLLVCSETSKGWRGIVSESHKWTEAYSSLRCSDNKTTLKQMQMKLQSRPVDEDPSQKKRLFDQLQLTKDFQNRFPTEIPPPLAITASKNDMTFFLEMLEERYQLDKEIVGLNYFTKSRKVWLANWQQQMESFRSNRSRCVVNLTDMDNKTACGVCLIF